MVELLWLKITNISLRGNSLLLFINNEATRSGGAGYFDFYCKFIVKGNANTTFQNNKALHGGAFLVNNYSNLGVYIHT